MKWLGLTRAPTWLSRTAWLALWGIWLWLGFGLYRELPRDLGPKVCSLDLIVGSEFMWGFAPERPEVITYVWTNSKRRTIYFAYDVHTGKRIGEVAEPRRRYPWAERRTHSLLLRGLELTYDPWNVYLPASWRTVAIRDLVSGRTIAREWQGIADENPDQTLVVDNRGVIRRYPMVNWPRLVFCQALLATPLLLRWLLQRWRRRSASIDTRVNGSGIMGAGGPHEH